MDLTQNEPSGKMYTKNLYMQVKLNILDVDVNQHFHKKQLQESDKRINVNESPQENTFCIKENSNSDDLELNQGVEEESERIHLVKSKTENCDNHYKDGLQITTSSESKSNNKEQTRIIDMLTEKQFEDDPNAVRSPKNFLVYRVRLAELTGSPLEYTPGDNGFFRVVLALAVFIMYLQMDFVMTLLFFAKCVRHILLSVKGFMLMLFCLTNIISINYIFCCSSQARVPPFSRMLLIIAASSQGYILAYLDIHQNGVGKAIALTTTIMAAVCFICAQTKYNFLSKKNLMRLIIFDFFLATASLLLFKFTTGFWKNEVLNLNTILILMSSFWFGMCIPFEIRLLIQKKAVDIGNRDYHQGAFMVFISFMDVFFKCLEAHD